MDEPPEKQRKDSCTDGTGIVVCMWQVATKRKGHFSPRVRADANPAVNKRSGMRKPESNRPLTTVLFSFREPQRYWDEKAKVRHSQLSFSLNRYLRLTPG
jgi:hypothetical protein